jgi:hypothetical protein
MRKFCYIFIFIIFLIHFKLCAQVNLVTNGDFENITQCPDFYSQIQYALGWSSPSLGTPDLLCACNGSLNSTNSVFGYQTPRSGNNCAAATYIDLNTPPATVNFREYIQNHLTNTLSFGHTYTVSFYISLADNLKYSTSRIGCYFSNQTVSDNTNYLLNVTPQINNPIGNFISDKINWVKIEANYVATGNENYLIIGNFFDDQNTDSLNSFSGSVNGASYFIDDVSVIDSSSIGINEINNKTNITIYPNPSNGSIQIDLSKLNGNGDLQFVVYNTLGVEIKKQQITANEIANVDLSDLVNCTYFYKVFKDGKLCKYDKLVLIK